MSYEIEWSDTALKHLKRLDKPIRARVIRAVNALKEEPRPAGVKPLKGEDNLWRIRVAKGYRVLYNIFDDLLTIEVVDADHRSRIYKR